MSKKVKFVITILVTLLALMAAVLYSIPSFIDKEGIRTQLVGSFKALTGLDLEVEGDVVVERFPTPHVVINSMYVHNAQGGIEPFLLTIKLVEIWPSYTALLSRKSSGLGNIVFTDVDLEAERLKNGLMNWADNSVQTSAPQGAFGLAGQSFLKGSHIIINNGYVRYTDENSGLSSDYKNINANFTNGGASAASSVTLGMLYNDRALSLSGSLGSLQQALSKGEVPANLSVTSGKSHLTYEGNAGYKENVLIMNGSVKFSTEDIVSWIDTFNGNNADTAQEYAGGGFKPLPLEAKSDIRSENGKIILPNLTIDGALIKGGLKVDVTPPYGFDISGIINSLDLETLLSSKLFATKLLGDPLNDKRPAVSNFQAAPKSVINFLTLAGDIKFEDTLYNDQHIKDGHVVFDMANGEMTLSQATATLPGDSRVVFAGIGKQGYQGFTLEGELDASGGDFSEAIKVIKANGVSFPAQDFKRFRLKATMVASEQELRLSELTARIENMAFVGGFIAKFSDRIKLEAAMRIGGLNLDHFTQIWGIQQWRTSLSDTTPGEKYDSYIARWLRRLDYDAAMNISLEQFVLQGKTRDKAEFRLDATSGKVSFNDIRTNYNGSNLNGYFVLDVRNPLPKIDIKAGFDTFDPDVFFPSDGTAATSAATPTAPPSPPPLPIPIASAAADPSHPATLASLVPQWSHDQFDFHWLELLTGTYHFTFDHLTHGSIKADSVNVLGSIDQQIMSIESISGIVQGAQVAGKANIVGGKIPSINIGANISNLESDALIPFFPVLRGMTGKYNLSVKLNTSGIDMYSWISTLQGSIGLGGDNVNIHGFNLPGVIRSVSYVRTVADILNVVRRAFPGGDTMFSNIEGQWLVSGGVIKTSNSRLTSDLANGILVSQIDLMSWQTQSSITLSLKALDPEHPPNMVINFAGGLDNPEISLDTRSLEQFVTNKTSERMLQQYGTQQ